MKICCVARSPSPNGAETRTRRSERMRVGLIADTHDRLPAIAELVRQMQAAGVATILHAGDYCSPFALRAFEDAHISLAGVFGRNDGDTQGLVSRAQAGVGAAPV